MTALERVMSAGPEVEPRVLRDAHIATYLLSRAAAVLRCLGHPLRLRLLEGLEGGERTVSELRQYAGVAQPVVSQHLTVLRAHGVVAVRRAGSFAYYSIHEPEVHVLLQWIRQRGHGAAGDDGGSPAG